MLILTPVKIIKIQIICILFQTFGFEEQLEPCDDTFNDGNMDDENEFSRFGAADDFKFDQNTPSGYSVFFPERDSFN